MRIHSTTIAGVQVVENDVRADDRGSFARWFCEQELADVLQGRHVVQINFSRTLLPGTVRGLHFQCPPQAEMKLVRCLRGRVWDVAVDVRAGSPTLLRWHAEELAPGGARMLVIPEGCAHGFQVMEPDSELLYLHTAAYTPDAEGGLCWEDPLLNIQWPLPVRGLSPRDRNHPRLDADYAGVVL